MNVYDFDGTIYRGDSSVEFYFYCLRRCPSIIRFLPQQVFGVLAYKLRFISKTQGKSAFFSFLRGLRDTHLLVRCFWKSHAAGIQQWYINQQNENDVVISASPEFLLAPICRLLNVRFIASLVDPKTGVFQSENCYGNEKVLRFRALFPHECVDAFYSDSSSDAPMAALARQSYMVINGNVYEWIRVQ